MVWPTHAEAQASAGCGAADEIGWVARIDALSTARGRSAPVLVRARSDHTMAETAPLCTDDVVRNPTGSNVRLWLRVAGRELVSVSPGDRPYHVRAPGWGMRFRSILSAIDGLAYWRRWRNGRATPARTRSSTSTLCRYDPAGASGAQYDAVAAWGPIVFAWPCNDPAFGVWRVTIETAGSRESVTTATNMVRIDPRHCRSSCTIHVTQDMMSQRVASFRLNVVEAAAVQLPEDLRGLDMDERGKALVGTWLMRNGRSSFRLQAVSLLWSAGCQVPSAGQVVAGWYGAPSPEDTCLGQ